MAWPSASARTKAWGTEILTSADLDGQFDILHTYINDMLNSTTGHKHSGGTSDGPLIPLTSGITGTLPVANGGTGSTAAINTAGGVVIPTGAVNAANGAAILNSSGFLTVSYPYVKISNTQTQNTTGGTTTSGGWNTCVFNTTDTDSGSISSLVTNSLTLPAGTYLANISVPIYNAVDRAQIRLYNNTGAAVLINGVSSEVLTSQVNCLLRGRFTIGISSALLIQYQVTTTQASSGQGVPGNFGAEVYGIAEFIKVG